MFRTCGNWERSGVCEKGKSLERQHARQGIDGDKGQEAEKRLTVFGPGR